MSETLQDELRHRCQHSTSSRDIQLMANAADRIDELVCKLAETQLSEYDGSCLKAGQYIQQACSELPDGYEIEICLEKDAGTVYLLDKYSDRIELCGDQGSFAADIFEAIEVAKEHAAEQAK